MRPPQEKISLKLRQRLRLQPLIPERNQGLFRSSFTVNTNLQKPKVNHASAVHPEQPDIACVAIAAGRQRRLSIPHGAVFHNLAGMKKTNRSIVKTHAERLFDYLTGNGGEHWERRKNLPLP